MTSRNSKGLWAAAAATADMHEQTRPSRYGPPDQILPAYLIKYENCLIPINVLNSIIDIIHFVFIDFSYVTRFIGTLCYVIS